MSVLPFQSAGRRATALLLGVAAAALAGCGGGPPPVKLYPVRGKILVGEKPVKEGTIQLRADQARGNTTWEQPVAAIQPDGTFEVTTNGKPGAPPGWYRVLVLADNFKVVDPPPSPVWPNYPEGFLPKPLVNDRYLYFNQTDVSVEVVEDPPEEGYVLRLKP
jgi:hypothetical protein